MLSIRLPRFKKYSVHAVPLDAVFLGVSADIDVGYYPILTFDCESVKKPLARGREFCLEEWPTLSRGVPLCSVELRLKKRSPDLHTFFVYEVFRS